MPDPVESSARRIVACAVLLLVPVVALTAAMPWVVDKLHPNAARAAAEPRPDRPATDEEIRASRRADEKLAEAEKSWGRSTAIPPADGAVDASGERVRRFQGFGVSVESNPAGGMVLVNGRDVGETPVTASMDCAQGEPVQVEVRMAGRRSQKRTTRCRADRLVEMSVELR